MAKEFQIAVQNLQNVVEASKGASGKKIEEDFKKSIKDSFKESDLPHLLNLVTNGGNIPKT